MSLLESAGSRSEKKCPLCRGRKKILVFDKYVPRKGSLFPKMKWITCNRCDPNGPLVKAYGHVV